MSRARDKANSTVSNFSSTGIDDNADANAITIDSSENVLVGGTNVYPADNNVVGHSLTAVGQLQSSVSGYAPFIGNRKSSDGDIAVFRKDGTKVGSLGTTGGDLTIDGPSEHTGLRFEATDITPRHNGSASNGVNDLGTSAARFKDLYLSGGAYIGGTGSANKLDDYEIGSFSLTEVQGSITGDTVRSGTYTKIGRMVMIDFDITGTAITISSYVGFSGLPFTPASTGTGFTSTEDIDLANGVEMAVGTNGRLYLSGGGGSDVSRISGSLVYRTA